MRPLQRRHRRVGTPDVQQDLALNFQNLRILGVQFNGPRQGIQGFVMTSQG